MGRILYVMLSNGVGVAGGHKMCIRHVETLRDLGFDASLYLGAGSKMPTWLSHRAPVEPTPHLQDDDIAVLPDDGPVAMKSAVRLLARSIIFSQNPYFFAGSTFAVLDEFPAAKFPDIIAVSEGLAATIKRAYPQARTHVVPCFADERLFLPAEAKRFRVAFAPRKRPVELAAIEGLFPRLHPRHRGLEWAAMINVSEAQMARALGESALFLSLSKLESVGMNTLEALASGALCAGFTGVGGLEYATAENGLWVADEDCEAAADALAEAADVFLTGGARLKAYRQAAEDTARTWSYANFRAALEETWMRLAPQTRLRNGPLD